MSLNPEEVGVWLFDSTSGGQGTHVENIPFGFEGGFDAGPDMSKSRIRCTTNGLTFQIMFR